MDPDLFNKNKPLFTTLKQKKQNEPSPKKERESPEDESSQYNWIKIIGQGTFGVVYKAERKSDNRKVAIKKVY